MRSSAILGGACLAAPLVAIYQLSVLLKPFTAPDAIWFEIAARKVQLRGYRRDWLKDAWDRYLPKDPSSD